MEYSKADSGSYNYKELSPDGAIRLLNLAPASASSADLHCELITYTLSATTTYEALSYVWGSSETPETLHLGTSSLKITHALATALRRLRLPGQSRLLWVDAVCINQSNTSERSQQVAQMANIYRYAVRVVAWLGEDEGGALDMKSILSLSQKAAEIGLRSPQEGNRDIFHDYVYGRSERINWMMSVMSEVKNSRFVSIYTSAWFTRMWIVQEALLAKHLILCYGVDIIEWDDFEKTMMLVQAMNAGFRLPMPNRDSFLKHAWSLVEIRDHWQRALQNNSDPAEEITFYMHQLRRRGCKDDRDRVFALQGLLPVRAQNLIEPDYEKSVACVYTELARSQLKLGNIGLLYDAGLWKRKAFQLPDLGGDSSSEASLLDYLPTWVPDHRNEITFQELAEMKFGGYFGADPRVPPQLDMSKEPYRLATQATLIDIVTYIQPAFFMHDPTIRTSDIVMFFICRQLCKDLKRTFDTRFDGRRYPANEDPIVAFANALIGGATLRDFEENRDPLALWEIYEKASLNEDGEVYRAMQKEAKMPEDRKNVKGVGIEFHSELSKDGSIAWNYHRHLLTILRRHWFFISDDGYAGLAPLGSQPDTDLLAFIDGANVPFVLRDLRQDATSLVLVGPCYIYGLMESEMAKMNSAFSRGVISII
ncbi:MAG: hypothetical protein Q9195_009249 [Heterodermia aff. obscurata]